MGRDFSYCIVSADEDDPEDDEFNYDLSVSRYNNCISSGRFSLENLQEQLKETVQEAGCAVSDLATANDSKYTDSLENIYEAIYVFGYILEKLARKSNCFANCFAIIKYE